MTSTKQKEEKESIDYSRLYREAKHYGGNDEITLKTIDLSNTISVKKWKYWLSRYGDYKKMIFIGEDYFRPVYKFVYGECPLCHEQMQYAGTSYLYEGIIVSFCCGSYKEGAKHRFVWSKGFAFPLLNANIAFLGSLLK